MTFQDPFVLREAARHSFLGRECVYSIGLITEKIAHIENEQQLHDKELILQQKEKIKLLEIEVNAYKEQADQMDSEF
jgi:hypothetical protein